MGSNIGPIPKYRILVTLVFYLVLSISRILGGKSLKGPRNEQKKSVGTPKASQAYWPLDFFDNWHLDL